MFFEQAIQKIKTAQNIAILTHTSEDSDALGSAFAMTEVLCGMGKHAVCYLSDTPELRLQFMGADYVVYTGEDVPAYDLCISLDSGSMDRLGARTAIFNRAKNTVNIDHHGTNTMFAEVNCIIGDISSTGELVYMLFQEMDVPLTQKVAKYLYTAIAGDTGGFKYSSVTPATMRIAADLLTFDIGHADICRFLFDTETEEALRFKGWVMQNIQSYHNGKLQLIVVEEADFSRFSVSEKDAGDLVNIARSVAGTDIAVAIRKLADNIKISFRSNGRYPVDALSLQFGGGGHAMAAGATVDVQRENIVDEVVAACGEIIHD